jgi:membrane-associated phospholipid phosphatase
MKKHIASITSIVLNPFLVSMAVIFLLSFESTSRVAEGVKWSLILIGVTILPMFLVILYLAHTDRVTGIFIRIRQQRHQIYALATLCMVAGYLILYFLQAPLVLLAAIVATLSSVVIFMVINLQWKISLHTAFAAGSATVLALVYGAAGALAAIMVPPVAWSRIELEQHTVGQAIAGALLAALNVMVVFHFFGLIGSSASL